MTSPSCVSVASSVPAGSSMAVRARRTQGDKRPGASSRTHLTAPLSLSRNRTSIGNFMPNMWTCLQRGKTRASPGSIESRSRRPRLRSARLTANRARVAMTGPRGELVMRVSAAVSGAGGARAFGTLAQNARRHAAGDGELGDVAGDDRPGPDDRAVSYADPLGDDDPGSQPAVLTDGDRPVGAVLEPHGGARLDAVVGAVDVDEGAEHGVSAYGQVVERVEDVVRPDADVVAHLQGGLVGDRQPRP